MHLYDVIIIGSGIAGLRLATRLSDNGLKVFIASKEAVTEGSSNYAQGGVAVVSPLNPEDKIESHIQDTIKASKGLVDRDVVSTYITEAWKEINDLILMGVDFDKDFNIEASHSFNRVMHVADATGRAILKPLLDKASCNTNISIAQGTELRSVIKSGESVVGARFKPIYDNQFIDIFAPNIVFATGGFTSLFTKSTTPSILTGDALAYAYDAGCILENLEFVQFHPTTFSFDNGSKTFLISEACRGAGAKLLNANKKSFIQKYHPDAELASRDVLSRAIFNEMLETDSDYVYLDMRHIDKDILIKKFPNIYIFCLDKNFDLSIDLLPISPAAHYCIGGIKASIAGETNIKGIYAVGECSSTGFHGANRLASNSLLECLVSASKTAENIISNHVSFSNQNIDINKLTFCSQYQNDDLDQESIHQNIQIIKEQLSLHNGIIRNQQGLEELIKNLTQIENNIVEKQSALLIAKSSLQRKESRGSHYREDYPEVDDVHFHKNTLITKNIQNKIASKI